MNVKLPNIKRVPPVCIIVPKTEHVIVLESIPTDWPVKKKSTHALSHCNTQYPSSVGPWRYFMIRCCNIVCALFPFPPQPTSSTCNCSVPFHTFPIRAFFSPQRAEVNLCWLNVFIRDRGFHQNMSQWEKNSTGFKCTMLSWASSSGWLEIRIVMNSAISQRTETIIQ